MRVMLAVQRERESERRVMEAKSPANTRGEVEENDTAKVH